MTDQEIEAVYAAGVGRGNHQTGLRAVFDAGHDKGHVDGANAAVELLKAHETTPAPQAPTDASPLRPGKGFYQSKSITPIDDLPQI